MTCGLQVHFLFGWPFPDLWWEGLTSLSPMISINYFFFNWNITMYFLWSKPALRLELQPTPVLLPGKSHGWRSLVGCSPRDREELDMTEWLHCHFSLSCIEGNGNPLKCSCLEKPRDGGAWWAAVYGVAQSWTWLKRLSSSNSSRVRHCVILFNLLNHSKLHFKRWEGDIFTEAWDLNRKKEPVSQWGGRWDQFSSVAQCPTLWDPTNRSTPGLPVHHQLPESTQTHVHRVGDAIQPSHPLSSPSPPAPNPSQHQSLSQWVNSSHEVAKVLEFQL